MESFRDRIGYDSGGTLLEDTLAFAAAHDFHYIDFKAGNPPNELAKWPADRAARVREACASAGIHLGLHTDSSINVAEYTPYVGDGVDRYLRECVDLGMQLGCDWVEVHAGYHFNSNLDERKAAALARLQRTIDYAKSAGMQLLIENLNFEPNRAEVHYLAHNVEEVRFFFDRLDAQALRWAFTVNHANLVPEGINGFLDAFGIGRMAEARLADNLGEYEIHMLPGTGNIDFSGMFKRIEGMGFTGHYMMALGNLDEKLAARDYFVRAFES